MKKVCLLTVLALMLIGILGAATITFDPTSLTGFSYILGCGPSSSQSSNISGSGLTGNITITPPTEYEISTTGDPNFSAQTSITLTPSGGYVQSTPIYVRLKAV